MKALSGVLAAAWLVFSGSPGFAGTVNGKVDYPEGYRQWAHIKSMLLEPGHPLENPFQGLHHVYGNDKAMKGLEGGKFSDGAVLVFDLLNYNQGGHAIQEGDRKLVGVMKKDSKAFAATGGWGFEGFAGDSKTDRLVGDGGAGCYACHTSQKEHDFVFTRPRK